MSLCCRCPFAADSQRCSRLILHNFTPQPRAKDAEESLRLNSLFPSLCLCAKMSSISQDSETKFHEQKSFQCRTHIPSRRTRIVKKTFVRSITTQSSSLVNVAAVPCDQEESGLVLVNPSRNSVSSDFALVLKWWISSLTPASRSSVTGPYKAARCGELIQQSLRHTRD